MCGLCLRCETKTESITHALRGCPGIKQMQKTLIDPKFEQEFFNGSTHEWIHWNMRNIVGKNNRVAWSILFGVCLWNVLEDRNMIVF